MNEKIGFFSLAEPLFNEISVGNNIFSLKSIFLH